MSSTPHPWMVNCYTQHFEAKCPNNGRRIKYTLTIEATGMLMVEDLQMYVRGIHEGFHENIADQLWERFGGSQVLAAWHHGTHVRTVRA